MRMATSLPNNSLLWHNSTRHRWNMTLFLTVMKLKRSCCDITGHGSGRLKTLHSAKGIYSIWWDTTVLLKKPKQSSPARILMTSGYRCKGNIVCFWRSVVDRPRFSQFPPPLTLPSLSRQSKHGRNLPPRLRLAGIWGTTERPFLMTRSPIYIPRC